MEEEKSQPKSGETGRCAWKWLKSRGLEILMFLAGPKVTLSWRKGALPRKKTQLAGSTGGGSCTMPCAWEPKMEIPGEHVIQFERPDAVIDSVREVWSEVRVTAPNDSLHPAANTKN
jgi:hypothetical protein